MEVLISKAVNDSYITHSEFNIMMTIWNMSNWKAMIICQIEKLW